jgi:hypothetical protein
MDEFLNQLSPVDRKKLENLVRLEDEGKELPVLEELQGIKGFLEQIANKPDLEMPQMPEIPTPPTDINVNNFPDVQRVEITNYPQPVKMPEMKFDLSKTNDLLQKLLNKEQENIEATLEII